MKSDFSSTLATHWLSAWRAKSATALSGLCEDDVVIESPLVPQILDNPTTSVQGKMDAEEYWSLMMSSFPEAVYELQSIRKDDEGVCLTYSAMQGLVAHEYFRLNDSGRIASVRSSYRARVAPPQKTETSFGSWLAGTS